MENLLWNFTVYIGFYYTPSTALLQESLGCGKSKLFTAGVFLFLQGRTPCHNTPPASKNISSSTFCFGGSYIGTTRKTFRGSTETATEGLFLLYSFGFAFRSLFILCLHEKQPDGIVLVLSTHNAQTDDPLDVFAQDIVQRGVLFRSDSRGGSGRLFVLV